MTENTLEGFRLSPQQSRIWALSQLDGRGAYRVSGFFRFDEGWDPARFKRALSEVVERHEILRTSFRRLAGMTAPLQIVHDRMEVRLEELAEAPAEGRVSFEPDLERGPLVVARFRSASPGSAAVELDLPALCADRTTMRLIAAEIAADLSGEPVAASAPLQYADVAEWFHELLEKPESAPGIEYWRRFDLRGADAPPLPFRLLDPALGFEPKRSSVPISLVPAERLRHFDELPGRPTRSMLLAAWQAFLQRLCGGEPVIIGYESEGRRLPELRTVLGPCARSLPLRTPWTEMPSLKAGALAVENVIAEQERWQHLFVEGATFALSFEYSDEPQERGHLWKLADVRSWIRPFELRLSCVRTANGAELSIEYDSGRIPDREAALLTSRFSRFLDRALAEPDLPLSAIDLLSEEDERLFRGWNSTDRPLADVRLIHERFEDAAHATPDAVALVYEDSALSFAELNERANQVAHRLARVGVGPDARVALCVERSLEMIVGLLGIWKAGAAYVPMDPSIPEERLRFLVSDTDASAIVTRGALAGKFGGAAPVVLFESEEPAPITNPDRRAQPDGLAYVIFTSGSTGTPKGVAVEHRQIRNYVDAILERLQPPAGSSFVSVTTLSADLGNTSIFPALATGGRLRVVSEQRASDPERLAEAFEVDPPDYLKIVPSHLGALLSASRPERLLPRRCLLLGGEATSRDLLERIRALAPSLRVINHYGPTEATIGVTTYDAADFERTGPSETVPVGRPLSNCRVYLLDENRQRVPPGVPGELHIAGAGVARGYWARPELTTERFPLLTIGGVGERVYRTGDLARHLPDGNIELLGRTDDQIKLHGFRIEPGEIETALRKHPAVREAAVLPREIPGLGKRLVAYLVPVPGEAAAAPDLRRHLAQTLPEFMMPSAFVPIPRLPLTPNGKIDRAALPLPPLATAGGEELVVGPRTPQERILTDIWAGVLRLRRFGIHDNFFELGGDSILAIQIIARAAREGLRLTPRQLFERQTIAELAQVAESLGPQPTDQSAATGSVPLTPIQHWFFEQALPEPHHFNQSMVVEGREALDPEAIAAAADALMAHHDALRLRFTRDSSGWRQESIPPGGQKFFSVVSGAGLDESQQEEAMARAAADAHASLDLTHGPLARVLYFDRGKSPARVMLIVHHLAVDGVSWRVLLEDLETAYRQVRSGEAPALPARTTSFGEWARKLEEIAQSRRIEQEAPYWLAENAAPDVALPPDFQGENTIASARSIETVLSPEETAALLHQLPAAYRTQINDALLTALARALHRATGVRSIRFALEGHGREEVVSGIDLSRTVGWFTSRFPVSLHLPGETEPGGRVDALLTIKEQLRAIPGRGIGYGILRYLSKNGPVGNSIKALPRPDISFNYLGQLDRVLADESLWRVLPTLGPERSPRNRRPFALAIEGRVRGERLRLSWVYSENVHLPATIARLAGLFEEELRALIALGAGAGEVAYTPSDFPKARMSQKDLEKLVATLKPGGRGRE
ncbi:MAG TPA: amino acid adenylation domain-containing protein [Thermoanaerobaculia bacterium]|nr:amino acid adenylation domain-containing protein [Thermoanaerobaculia bacterium]